MTRTQAGQDITLALAVVTGFSSLTLLTQLTGFGLHVSFNPFAWAAGLPMSLLGWITGCSLLLTMATGLWAQRQPKQK